MEKIKVKLERNSYQVILGKGVSNKILGFLEELNLYKNLFIVVDKNVEKYHGTLIKNCFNNVKGKKYFYSFNAVEKSKSIAELKNIYACLMEHKFGRDTTLISIGGGITGDLAGFAAATYMRGIPLINIPTTLTAMVDSSIGGKTGINFNYYKNIIGSFYQPQLVLCDLQFLKTLPKNEMICGAGEVIKYAFTTDSNFFKYVDKNLNLILDRNEKVLERVIKESVLYKSSVVSKDEKEGGLRKVLNFGHTFAHAFEKELKNKIKHGEAVSAGIVCALYLSYKKNLLSKIKLEQYKKLPLRSKISRSLKSIKAEKIYESMIADKKNKNSQINFVLIHDIGEMILDVNASKREILDSIDYLNVVME